MRNVDGVVDAEPHHQDDRHEHQGVDGQPPEVGDANHVHEREQQGREDHEAGQIFHTVVSKCRKLF